MFEKQVLGGFLASIDVIPPLIVTFQFNPEKISDNKTVKYADRDADLCGNSPGKVYTGGGDRTISFDIKLHGLEKGMNPIIWTAVDNGISTELAKLRSFLYPREDAWVTLFSEEGKRISSPPSCIFGFGTKILECVVSDIKITETQFNSMLAPVQADVTITLIVKEEKGSVLYEADRHHRNLLATLGLRNIRGL